MLKEYISQLKDFIAGCEQIQRLDNAPHFPEIPTFPHHKHTLQSVIPHEEISGLDFLVLIFREL